MQTNKQSEGVTGRWIDGMLERGTDRWIEEQPDGQMDTDIIE